MKMLTLDDAYYFHHDLHKGEMDKKLIHCREILKKAGADFVIDSLLSSIFIYLFVLLKYHQESFQQIHYFDYIHLMLHSRDVFLVLSLIY